MTYEDYSWYEEEPLDIIKEANERAREIISMLRLAIINTSFYDHANYVRYGMHGDPESAAFKKMFNMKLEFVQYLEKETRLVFANNEHYYNNERREIKDKMIDELMSFMTPHLRGGVPGPHMFQKTASIVDKIMNRSEQVLEDGIMTKGKMLGKPANLFQSPVIELKSEMLY
jgi:hypothetical protein